MTNEELLERVRAVQNAQYDNLLAEMERRLRPLRAILEEHEQVLEALVDLLPEEK